jgi:glycosyltransferase involved in cell wall biosynthesis
VHLTIAIPTWKRAKYLKENLEALLYQISIIEELVIIVVSDNASSDDTESMVAELISIGAPIKYWRNDLNVGFDKNVHLAVQRREGDIVLLLGDDDRLAEEALSEVLVTFKRHTDLGLIYMNSRAYDDELRYEIDFHDVAFDRIEEDTYFKDGLDVLFQSQIFQELLDVYCAEHYCKKRSPSVFLILGSCTWASDLVFYACFDLQHMFLKSHC